MIGACLIIFIFAFLSEALQYIRAGYDESLTKNNQRRGGVRLNSEHNSDQQLAGPPSRQETTPLFGASADRRNESPNNNELVTAQNSHTCIDTEGQYETPKVVEYNHKQQLARSALHAIQTFWGFFVMLITMT